MAIIVILENKSSFQKSELKGYKKTILYLNRTVEKADEIHSTIKMYNFTHNSSTSQEFRD